MLFAREIPATQSYDLVVCGGGVTGFAAAVAAARRGLKVAIMERFGCLGGVVTSCGVNHLLAGRKYDEPTGKMVRKIGGIFDELTDELIQSGAAVDPDTIDVHFNPFGWYPRMAAGIAVDAEKLKVVMDRFCLEAGVDLHFFTSFIDAEVERDRISRLVFHNKGGLFAIAPGLVVDATGDADVAYRSGCPTLQGRAEDGLMAPASLEMYLEHVDGRALVEYQNEHQSPKLVEIIQRLRESGEWTFPYEIFVAVRVTEPDVFLINTIRQVGVDGTDPDSVTRAMIEGRAENMRLFEIIKANFPGFGKARIRKIAEVVGVRETRRIVGRHTITLEEALTGKNFPDSVAGTTYNFDLPDPKRPSFDPMMGNAANPNPGRKYEYIQIPYRALLPERINNLIVAGRCISAERAVLGPIRIMGPCMGMGQAAGTAAVLAMKQNYDFSKADPEQLRRLLIGDLVLIPADIGSREVNT
jgi:hypothetical protein